MKNPIKWKSCTQVNPRIKLHTHRNNNSKLNKALIIQLYSSPLLTTEHMFDRKLLRAPCPERVTFTTKLPSTSRRTQILTVVEF